MCFKNKPKSLKFKVKSTFTRCILKTLKAEKHKIDKIRMEKPLSSPHYPKKYNKTRGCFTGP